MHAVVDGAASEAAVEQVGPKASSQQDPLRPLRIPTDKTLAMSADRGPRAFDWKNGSCWNPKGVSKGLVGISPYQAAPVVHATVDAAAPEASVEQVDPKALLQQDPSRPLRIPTKKHLPMSADRGPMAFD